MVKAIVAGTISVGPADAIGAVRHRRLAVLGRRIVTHVALAQLVRVRVHGQRVRVVDGLGCAAALEQRAELGAVARRVVVGGRGAEALLLLAMAAKHKLGEGRDDEEEARRGL